MTARSPEKGNKTISYVKGQVPGAPVTFLELDLSSFDSIKRAAKTVLLSSPRLDVLMLNAGCERILSLSECSNTASLSAKLRRCCASGSI